MKARKTYVMINFCLLYIVYAPAHQAASYTEYTGNTVHQNGFIYKILEQLPYNLLFHET